MYTGNPGVPDDVFVDVHKQRLMRLYAGTSEIQRVIIGSGLVRARRRRTS